MSAVEPAFLAALNDGDCLHDEKGRRAVLSYRCSVDTVRPG